MLGLLCICKYAEGNHGTIVSMNQELSYCVPLCAEGFTRFGLILSAEKLDWKSLEVAHCSGLVQDGGESGATGCPVPTPVCLPIHMI